MSTSLAVYKEKLLKDHAVLTPQFIVTDDRQITTIILPAKVALYRPIGEGNENYRR